VETLLCLALAIYFEASDQSIKGKEYVGDVIISRTLSEKYPNDVCKVVFQNRRVKKRLVYQFSFLNQFQDRFVPIPGLYDKAWVESKDVAWRLLNNKERESKPISAMCYHKLNIFPYWARGNKIVAIEQDHVFYSRC
jgi:spore germination cell wall hydrolase CwlJ-like protein